MARDNLNSEEKNMSLPFKYFLDPRVVFSPLKTKHFEKWAIYNSCGSNICGRCDGWKKTDEKTQSIRWMAIFGENKFSAIGFQNGKAVFSIEQSNLNNIRK